MWKEIIICIVIVIAIIFGEIITQNYTNESINELTSKLMQLREDVMQKQENNEKLSKKAEEIYQQWRERFGRLAYFIEHDELEKVEKEMVAIKSYMEIEEYNEAISELDICVFILNHIKDKYDFNLQNIS